MDILTLELFDVTVSAALKEINRALEDHPALPLRILLGHDEKLHHNILRVLERQGRTPFLRNEGGRWRIEVAGLASGLVQPSPAQVTRLGPPAAPGSLPLPPPPPAPAPSPAPAARQPILLTRSCLGQGSAAVGRRLLLGILRGLDPAVPWLCLALEGLELLEDPQSLRVLEAIQAQGVPVRISRDSQLFPTPNCPFEIMEDSHWQRLAGRGEIVIL